MKLEIKEPCHEDWNNMKIGMMSRHCAVCDKGVMDFTKMNRAEIITYILSNPNDQVCGRMHKNQFDFRHEDIPVLIETLKKQKTANPFLILALVCISLSSCAQEVPEGNIKTPDPIERTMGQMIVTPPDTTDSTNTPIEVKEFKGKVACEPNTIRGEVEPVMIGDIDIPVAGGIGIVHDPVENPEETRVYQFAQKMPEFNGGIDQMMRFVNSKLKYPAYERGKGIQGNVYVRFVVEKDGTLTRPEILQSVEGSKNFDSEVKRLILSMPEWIPGENNGTKIPVYMTLPIRFVIIE